LLALHATYKRGWKKPKVDLQEGRQFDIKEFVGNDNPALGKKRKCKDSGGKAGKNKFEGDCNDISLDDALDNHLFFINFHRENILVYTLDMIIQHI
jgi:hypothetical protein